MHLLLWSETQMRGRDTLTEKSKIKVEYLSPGRSKEEEYLVIQKNTSKGKKMVSECEELDIDSQNNLFAVGISYAFTKYLMYARFNETSW